MKRKLIEVAIPLEAINAASAREKGIRHGHPSNFHPWWARRPLAACRAVLFASLVDDPSSDPDRFPTLKAQEDERQRLFRIIEDLVQWENSTDELVLERARAEILGSTGGNPPPVLDPFCGGGSIPLEAQRLGLKVCASDLNPVAVLITKALVEIPPKFAGLPPVHPDSRRGVGATGAWTGVAGLAEDVRRYGLWMRDEAERRIGHLYPKVTLPKEHGGGKAAVIAWLWARTVVCPNPACGARTPLYRSPALSAKKGREAWAEAVVDRATKEVRFEVRRGRVGQSSGTVGRQGAWCVVCGSPMSLEYIRTQGRADRLRAQLMAIAAEGPRGRVYVAPTMEQESIESSATPPWTPQEEIAFNPRDIKAPTYGLTRFADLFTRRQLVTLTTLSSLVAEVHARVSSQAGAIGDRDGVEYANAVATYLAFALDKLADLANSICPWEPVAECPRNLFGRQAIPMQWSYAEGNPLGNSSGSFSVVLENQERNSARCSPRLPKSRPSNRQTARCHLSRDATQGRRQYGSPVLREHHLCRLGGLLLRLAPTHTRFHLPRPVSDTRNSEGGRARCSPVSV